MICVGEFMTPSNLKRLCYWQVMPPCLADLLHRWHSGELDCDISCVISNHENLRSMVEWHNIPFKYVPVDRNDKASAFAEMESIIDSYNADTVVLARYMSQIIPPQMCAKYKGRMINIHHSFLAFIYWC